MTNPTRCRHRLPDPVTAGYATMEALRAAAERSPDLRPCPRHKGEHGTWNWLERRYCESCPDRETPPEVTPPKSLPSEVTPHVRKA